MPVNMTRKLIPFAENGDSRTYTLPGHTVLKPRQLVQRRKVAANKSANSELVVRVVYGTVDSLGVPLNNKVSLGANVSYPVSGIAADLDSAIADFRDYVASDEFVTSIKTQNWLVGAP